MGCGCVWSMESRLGLNRCRKKGPKTIWVFVYVPWPRSGETFHFVLSIIHIQTIVYLKKLDKTTMIFGTLNSQSTKSFSFVLLCSFHKRVNG